MVIKTVLFTPPDKDNAALCLDKKRVHWGGKATRRAGGSGESFLQCKWQGLLDVVPLKACSSFLFFLAVGYHSCEDQQWRGGGSDEGAEAAKRAAGVRLPLGCSCGWCQRTLGKVNYREGGQECRKKTDNHHFMPHTCLHGCLLTEGLLCSFFMLSFRWIQRNSLWFITWRS